MQRNHVLFVSLTLSAFCVTGCGSPQEPISRTTDKPKPVTTPIEGEGHSHGSGPNGGAVADWGGGKYHVEFTVDHDRQEATVFILGGDAKTPAPIKTDKLLLSISDPQFQVDLNAAPLDGEAEGSASRFVGKHERLGKVQEFAGTISGEVDGKPYAGDFQEQPESSSHK